jgi:hypothetical protein
MVCFESRVDGWQLELVEYVIFQRVLVPLVGVFAVEACEKFVVPSESYADSTAQFLSVNKHFNVDEKHYRSSPSTSFSCLLSSFLGPRRKLGDQRMKLSLRYSL